MSAVVPYVNELLRERLSQPFRLHPNLLEGETIDSLLESTQANYELAKGNEMQAALEIDSIKFTDASEEEAAITRLIDAAPKKPDGTSTLSRTPAEKLAKIEPEYVKYRRRLQEAIDDKRTAERWHSIAYQRLETLREVFKKS
jgi:hypothetical protein